MPAKVGDNAAVQTAKSREKADDGLLLTGIRARLIPVSASLIDEVTARVRDPEVPVVTKDDGTTHENPNDPAYIRALEEADRKRGQAAMDAIVMFGVKLVDALPQDDSWLRDLARVGIEVDKDDLYEVEFAYKKYVAVSGADLNRIMELSGVSAVGVANALDSFPDS